MKKIINIITTILIAILVVFAGLLFVPKVFGIEPMAVLSGSMEPTYHVGSVIYVNKNVSQEDIKVGDPITFSISEDTVVTHRVIEIDSDGNYHTKGDANDSADGGSVSFNNVIGVPMFTIPYLGYIGTFVSTTTGTILLVTFILVIILLTFLPDVLGSEKEEKKKGGKSDEE